MKRYEFSRESGPYGVMEQDGNGTYVEFEDAQKLIKAIRDGAQYLTFHSQGKGATEFFQMNEDAGKILSVLKDLGIEHG